MRYQASALLLLFICSGLAGQQGTIPGTHEEVLSFSIKALPFAKNNEYFNPIGGSPFILSSALPHPVDKSLWIEGYTLTGFFFRPELVYKASEKVTLRAGVHLLKYSGKDNFTTARPLLSVSLKLSEKTRLTLGSLSGSDSHRMFDPHFDSERLYLAYAEEGLQLRTIGDRIFNDAWVNWENYIFAGDTTREIFTFGESFRYTSPPIAGIIDIEFPVQLQFRHLGGQISNYPEKVTTFFNLAAGPRVNFDLAGKRYGRAGIEYLVFLNNVMPQRSEDHISKGLAHWFRLHYSYKAFYAGAYYWKAHDFYAPNGNGIYASVFRFGSDYIIHKRKIVTTAAYINLLPEEFLELSFGIETYYDISTRHLDHAMLLHLNFEKLFRLR